MSAKKEDYENPLRIRNKAMSDAIQKYDSEVTDSLRVRVPAGAKDQLKEWCKTNGTSLNGLIGELLTERTQIQCVLSNRNEKEE